MAINVNPQNGVGVTTYPYVYENRKLTITSTDYVVSNGGSVVTCHLKLSNNVIITGVHEQHHDKNETIFKNLAYQRAIDRAEQLGFLLS